MKVEKGGGSSFSVTGVKGQGEHGEHEDPHDYAGENDDAGDDQIGEHLAVDEMNQGCHDVILDFRAHLFLFQFFDRQIDQALRDLTNHVTCRALFSFVLLGASGCRSARVRRSGHCLCCWCI